MKLIPGFNLVAGIGLAALLVACAPSLTSEAEGSAANLDALKKLIKQNHVSVVFTELGTSPRTVEALAKEAKVTAVSIATHNMPADGNYFSFERELATAIIQGLKK